MRRRIFRPFFDFNDSFFLPRFLEPPIRFTAREIPINSIENIKGINSNDPHDVFEKFFN